VRRSENSANFRETDRIALTRGFPGGWAGPSTKMKDPFLTAPQPSPERTAVAHPAWQRTTLLLQPTNGARSRDHPTGRPL
jgi:hypothetical protein